MAWYGVGGSFGKQIVTLGLQILGAARAKRLFSESSGGLPQRIRYNNCLPPIVTLYK